MYLYVTNRKELEHMGMNDYDKIVSDEEYQEFLKFVEEYKRKREEKKDNSFLMWIYNKLNNKK